MTITAPEPAIVPAAASASMASPTSRPSGPSTGAEAPPGMIALSFATLGDAAAAALDQVAQRGAERQLVVAGPLDVAREREQRACPCDCSVPISAYCSAPMRRM